MYKTVYMKADRGSKPLSGVKIRKRVWARNLQAVAPPLTFLAVH
jgi:hypothetical protein